MSEKRQTKATQARHERMLNELLKIPGNNCCADCEDKNPRWVSYTLGIFLCVRCASIHRKMGTHISRIKSIIMDQWTPEQIEMVRSAGGNIKMNSMMNPHPDRNAIPLGDDSDRAMEKFIRNKWEKKAFMDKPPRKEGSSLAPTGSAVARLQTVPKRSSSVPVVFRDYGNYNAAMAKLKELGFRDEAKNQHVLRLAQGNVEAAAQILARGGQVPMSLNVFGTMTETEKCEKLRELGFTDNAAVQDALRRAGGNVDVAISLLRDAKEAILSSAPVTPITPTTPSVMDQPLAGRAQSIDERQGAKLINVQAANRLEQLYTPTSNTNPFLAPQPSPTNPFTQAFGQAQSVPNSQSLLGTSPSMPFVMSNIPTAQPHNPFMSTGIASMPNSPSTMMSQPAFQPSVQQPPSPFLALPPSSPSVLPPSPHQLNMSPFQQTQPQAQSAAISQFTWPGVEPFKF